MYIYLPIAEISMHIAVVIGLGGGVGFLSGMFGVGGGFLMTPLLIFLGVPSAVAVSTEANQIVASSVSGVLAHWRRGNVDFKMGGILVAGGLVGSSIGVLLFSILRDIGQIDLVIRLSYVVFLGIIGVLMLMEAARAILRTRQPGAAWSAAEGQVPQIKALHQCTTAFLPSRLCRHSVRNNGCGWRLYSGARHDLSIGHAHVYSDRHIAFPNHFCHCKYYYSAVCSDANC